MTFIFIFPLFRQLPPPLGYDPVVYGPWPRQGAHCIKVRVPPSWHTTYTQGKFHTVTFLLAHERDPAINPLMLGEGMEQVLDSHCTCRGGDRTACSCTHRSGVYVMLAATECWNSAKVTESVQVDTAR